MDILYLLVPLSVLVVLGLVAIFAWALFSDQFEDLAREGERILDDEQRQP
jgi:cbb3-type cytochrome oxidase maturation protein